MALPNTLMDAGNARTGGREKPKIHPAGERGEVAFQIVTFLPPNSSSWSVSLPIPNLPALDGQRVMMQTVFVDSVKVQPFITTNALLLGLGK